MQALRTSATRSNERGKRKRKSRNNKGQTEKNKVRGNRKILKSKEETLRDKEHPDVFAV